MKIIHLIWSFNIGGAETMLANIASEQAQMGEDVSLIIINDVYDDGLVKSINGKVKIKLLKRKPGSRSPFPIIWLNVLLLLTRPLVVHCHVASIINYIFKPLHKKTVLTMHTTGINHTHNTLSKYSKVFAISDSVKIVLKEQLNINATTIMNGVVFNKMANAKQKTSDKVFKIVSIGRLVDNIKGHSILIKAIGDIPKGISVCVDIIGDGPDMSTLRSLCQKLHIEDRVHLLGTKSQSYIRTHLCEYDLLVQPSFIEGFGLTIVEAMAAKVPVLVSDIDGTSEVVSNGKYGACFKVGDHCDLAKKITEIICNIDQHRRIAEEAYEYAIERYSLTNTARKYIDNYTDLNEN